MRKGRRATSFLFVQDSSEDSYLSLRLDEHGQPNALLERRTVDSLKELQKDARVLVVLPTERCGLYHVELPWLDVRKARAAIPYALEEQVAQSVTSLHIAFDHQHYENNRYLVVVIDKAFLSDLMANLDASGLWFDSITLDWFALKANEACVSETGLLISDANFQGALSGEPLALYLANRENLSTILLFNDSAPALRHASFTRKDCSFYEWVAAVLFNANPMSLCQGDFQHNLRKRLNSRWYSVSGILAGLWFVIFLGSYFVMSYQLNHKIKTTDQQIATIYYEFFPHAKQVISPKFRVSHLLSSNLSGQDSVLWQLLNTMAQAMNDEHYTINQFRYENKMLSVTLISQDFAALETLQHRLQQAHVNVTQAQATSHRHHVLATLELRL